MPGTKPNPGTKKDGRKKENRPAGAPKPGPKPKR